MFEAICKECGETFVPNDENDTRHGECEDGTPCGGLGVIQGFWIYST